MTRAQLTDLSHFLRRPPAQRKADEPSHSVQSGHLPPLFAGRGGGARTRAKFIVVEGMDDAEAQEFLERRGLWGAAPADVRQRALDLSADRLNILTELVQKKSPQGTQIASSPLAS